MAENVQQQLDEIQPENQQDIFERRMEDLIDKFSIQLKEIGINTAMIIMENNNMPISFSIGHMYDNAKITASVLRAIKNQIEQDLSIG